ncbi:CRISPR-associated endonuclease Cas1 [Thiorhodospira sibirica]|uniref:CRISPR-associated endonuclease Cas1 n=1 Tax=Thiorhodospira sibirica TaxID=154347 RepID=UPI00022C5E0E|nr:CRISPR-associated endonuclease Cas1 [Thiorhodospira sibirica]
MDKATLIIDQAGASISFQKDVLVLRQPDGAVHRIGIKALKQIIIKKEISLSSRLLEQTLKEGISLVVFPAQRGEATRHVFAQASGALHVRMAQYKAYFDPAFRVTIAKQFIINKLEGQAHCLRHYGLNSSFQRFILHARQCEDIPSLMGVEGAASAYYFKQWPQLLLPEWGFHGRNRRPPKDPVNALLSLSYMLACHAVGRLTAQDGYETTLGFLHAGASGRPSLALDLVEPLRPWIDTWVLSLCHQAVFKPSDFFHDTKQGCRLEKKASRQFFNLWFTTIEKHLEQRTRIELGALRDALGITTSMN